jgi:hypothetical protein
MNITKNNIIKIITNVMVFTKHPLQLGCSKSWGLPPGLSGFAEQSYSNRAALDLLGIT